MKNEKEIKCLAKILWDYHHMNHKLEKADLILVLGSYDTRVAERTAQIYFENWAPKIVFSGGKGAITKDWERSEAEVFSEIAIQKGVPKDNIIIEDKSTNTGENIQFTRAILKEKNIFPSKVIVVQKPYMERRSYATIKKLWPEMEIVVTSPNISFEEFPVKERTMNDLINKLVGDLSRIKIYPERGFQIFQEIPPEVEKAFQGLIEAGYTKFLIK